MEVVATVNVRVMEEAVAMDNNNRWVEWELWVVKISSIQTPGPIMEVLHHQCLMDQPSNKTHHLILNAESYLLEQSDL